MEIQLNEKTKIIRMDTKEGAPSKTISGLGEFSAALALVPTEASTRTQNIQVAPGRHFSPKGKKSLPGELTL